MGSFPIRNVLNRDEIDILNDKIRDPDTNDTLRTRCIVAKLFNEGASMEELKYATGVPERTLRRYLHDIRDSGISKIVRNGWEDRWNRDRETVNSRVFNHRNRVKLIDMELRQKGEQASVRRIQQYYEAHFNEKISVGTIQKYLKQG